MLTDLVYLFAVHIPTGSLPKGLHTLNLSRNKINTIEGLREMTRLRVLDLSYNRIFRIGHGNILSKPVFWLSFKLFEFLTIIPNYKRLSCNLYNSKSHSDVIRLVKLYTN